jgi:hypothetical protein
MLTSLVNLVVYLIVAGIIVGLLLYLVNISPVPEPWKGWLWFLVMAIGVLVVIYALINLIGGGGGAGLSFPIFPAHR